jgi:hypothetical protein
MSLPEQKAMALNQTREWLFKLLNRRYQPTMTEIRDTASRLLKHFPWSMDAEVMEQALIAQHNRAMKRVMRNTQRLIRDVNRAHKATAKSKQVFKRPDTGFHNGMDTFTL